MTNLTLAAAARRQLFIVRNAAQPLLVGVDRAGHLRLLRRTAAGTWSGTDLSPALPGTANVCCADVRQAPDGTLCIAIATRDGALHVAAGLPVAQDETGWLETMRHLPAITGLPAGTRVTGLAFGPLQAGAPPLLLIHAGSSTWYCQAAAPTLTLRALHLPAAQVCEIGSYRQPGVWALQPQGRGNAVRFLALRDPFGWEVALDYPDLPPHTQSLLVAPGSIPNVPDLYAAGEHIVVYRGGNTLPQRVAPVAGARLLWSHAQDGAEYLAYADAGEALWMLVRRRRAAWSAPFLLTRHRAVLAVAGQFIHAAVIDEGRLEVQRFTLDGLLYSSEIVAGDW